MVKQGNFDEFHILWWTRANDHRKQEFDFDCWATQWNEFLWQTPQSEVPSKNHTIDGIDCRFNINKDKDYESTERVSIFWYQS